MPTITQLSRDINTPDRPYIPRVEFKRTFGGDAFVRLLNNEFRGVSQDLQKYAAPAYTSIWVPTPGWSLMNGGAQSGLATFMLPREYAGNGVIHAHARYFRNSADNGSATWQMSQQFLPVGSDLSAPATVTSTQRDCIFPDTGVMGQFTDQELGSFSVPGTPTESLVGVRLSITGGTMTCVLSISGLWFEVPVFPRGTRYSHHAYVTSA